MNKKVFAVCVSLMMCFACTQTLPDRVFPLPNQNEKTEKWGFVYDGRIIVKYKYDDADEFSNGLARVGINGVWGYIDKTGKEIVPLKYDFADNFNEYLAKVGLNGMYGLIDITGKEIIPLKYEEFGSFSNDLIRVSLDGKHGFIDKTGKEVIPLMYDDAGDFSEGLSNVSLNGKYGYIDETGSEIIPFIYDSAYRFDRAEYDTQNSSWGGEARVQRNGNYYLINKKGEMLLYQKMRIEFRFDDGFRLIRDEFRFIDEASREEITFNKMVIDGETVVRIQSYKERSSTATGTQEATVADFSMTGGKSVKYYRYGPIPLPIEKKYTLKNGILSIL